MTQEPLQLFTPKATNAARFGREVFTVLKRFGIMEVFEAIDDIEAKLTYAERLRRKQERDDAFDVRLNQILLKAEHRRESSVSPPRHDPAQLIIENLLDEDGNSTEQRTSPAKRASNVSSPGKKLGGRRLSDDLEPSSVDGTEGAEEPGRRDSMPGSALSVA